MESRIGKIEQINNLEFFGIQRLKQAAPDGTKKVKPDVVGIAEAIFPGKQGNKKIVQQVFNQGAVSGIFPAIIVQKPVMVEVNFLKSCFIPIAETVPGPSIVFLVR
jgi:hypothetical protein